LQLSEHSGDAEERHRQADQTAEGTGSRRGNVLRDVLHDVDRAFVQKITHLLNDETPRTSRIVTTKKADQREAVRTIGARENTL
jgi:hypothetical protein